MPSLSKESSFKTIQRLHVDYSPTVITHYQSTRTGMQVVAVEQNGPKVHGFFTLATEIFDDSGAPHTLEHLIFMGSRNYTYKGFLDKLATRAYSNTNAWTATDHTAYTLETAGWDGFAQMLPVYLEHVLLPTLTDAGCYTEVHHVDGTGKDAGVVYSEMQDFQSNQNALMDLRARRLLYPENVGLRYETGGMLEQLRVLSADRIRAFHQEMYQPKNLSLVIIGIVDHQNLLEILETFENGILHDFPSPEAPFKRPWMDSVQPPPLERSIIESVEFPEEDESSGEILVGFLGPDRNDVKSTAALNVLMSYLADSSISVLENTLVEKEQVASEVYQWTDSHPAINIWFTLRSVATEQLEAVEKRFFEVLREAASRPLDMAYLHECLHRYTRRIKAGAEADATYFMDPVINEFLFGKRDGSTLKSITSLQEYDGLTTWTDRQWRDFLKRWISDAAHVSILGVPSAKLSEKIKTEEEARVKLQRERLGEKGLRDLEKKLEEAKAENEKDIPQSLLERFKIPGTESIHFIPTTTGRSGAARKAGSLGNPVQELIDQDDPNLPLFIHFESIPSNFVEVALLFSTELVPLHLRPLLSVYIDNFFSTPVYRNGQRIEFETVVGELEKDSIRFSIDEAGHVGMPEGIRVEFMIEPDKYERTIEWLREMLFDSIFDEIRLKSSVTKLLADVPEEKRDGKSMARAIQTMSHFAPESIARATSTLVKALYLKRTKRLLEKDPQLIISQLENIRSCFCRSEGWRAIVIANVKKLTKPVSAWKPLLRDLKRSEPLLPLDRPGNRLSQAGKRPGGLAYLVPMPTIDSSFSIHTAKGPSTYTHSSQPPLMVALAYLDACEGPLWCAIRGAGLAYGTHFQRETKTGMLHYTIHRSPDAYKAFVVSKKVIEAFVDGSSTFDTLALEGAISAIVMDTANEQETMGQAALVSFLNQVVREVPSTYNEDMLRQVKAVTVDDIKRVMKEVILPVFQPETSNVFCTCAPIMEKEIKEGFASSGFKLQVEPLSYFHDDYGLKADGEEDDADDDDVDDDNDDDDDEDDDDDDDDDE